MDSPAVTIIRRNLSNDIISLNENDEGIFEDIDAFVELCEENQTVEDIFLHPYTDPDVDASRRYAFWDKAAVGIGKLQALRQLTLYMHDEEEHGLDWDWEILARTLLHLQRGIQVVMEVHDHTPLWDTEALPAFAGAIHGQVMITGFSTGDGSFPFRFLNILCSTLLTLPALENVEFHGIDYHGTDEGQYLEGMVELLQSPTLRVVKFRSVSFPLSLSGAVAEALKEESEITDLHFVGCSFSRGGGGGEGGGAVIVRALKTNTALKCLDFHDCDCEANEHFYEVLVAALLSNSTMQKLALPTPNGSAGSCSWLTPLFLALQVNNGLKELLFSGKFLIDEKLSTAMRLGLGKNSTLESLRLWDIHSGDNDTALWLQALSFIRTNRALKTLEMDFEDDMMKSDATAFGLEIVAALCENESLETLLMARKDPELEDYLVLLAAIPPNTTLKSLRLHPSHNEDFYADEDETEYLILVLEKNYGLEELPELHHGEGDICSILRLNRAGRRYLVQDGSSISKGVDVLSRVNDDINSVFLHLLENPRLCDRSAVETASIGNI
jgi:hypothetical protein